MKFFLNFKKFTLSIYILFGLLTSNIYGQYYYSNRQVYSRSTGNKQIIRISGPRYYGPHPGCEMCLGNHLLGYHHQDYDYLNQVGWRQWSILHDNLHNHKTIQNKSPKKQNKKPLFVPTPQHIVDKMLELADISKNDVVYDLGSGDGRIVITAAKKYGCKAVGYEIQSELVKIAKENVATHNVKNLVEIIEKDILTLDLTKANVITLYLFEELNEKLIPQLMKLKPGSRIISYHHTIPGIREETIYAIKQNNTTHLIYIWTTPIQFIGTRGYL